MAIQKEKKLNSWDPRPWPAKGDSIEVCYAAVGAAITSWERYEAVLSFIFSSFVVTKSTEKLQARRAYNAVRTFEGRSQMLRAASASYFYLKPNEELQKEFKEILKLAVLFSERRNEIVHGVVTVFRDPPPGTNHPENQFALVPSYCSFAKRDADNTPTYCYAVPEILHYQEQFQKILDPAWEFLEKLDKVNFDLVVAEDIVSLVQRHAQTNPQADPENSQEES